MKLHHALLPALLAVLASGCLQEPNRLEGSIGSSVSLEFDHTRLVRYIDSLTFQLEYLRALEGGGDDVVAKIVFDEPAGGVAVDKPIDLVSQDGVVERIVAAGDAFPLMDTGTLTFEQGGQEPGPAAGTFAVTFENGRTLNGAFSADLEDVQL